MEFSIAYLLIFFLVLFLVLKIVKVSFSLLKKTLILCLLLLVLYAFFVNAEVSKIYSGYVFSQETLTVDKKPFIVSLEDHDKLMLKYGANYFFMKKGECKEIYNLRFCFGNTMWDIDEKREKINLSVYSIEPTITIERSIDKNTFFVGDEAEITTIIENSDGLSAENVLFTDTFTPEFKITDIFNCEKKNNTVYWEGYIKENDSIKCEYTIEALDEIERSFRAKVEYFDGLEMQDEFSDALAIKVNPLLEIKTEFNDTDRKIYLGQSVYLKINLTNKNDEDMKIKYFDIYVPDGLEYLGTARIKTKINATDYQYTTSSALINIGKNIYRFSSDLKKNNQSKIVIPAFKSIFAGKSNIYMKTEYETEGETRFKEKIEAIEVETHDLLIHSNLEDNEDFDTGIEKLVRVYIENPIGSTVYFKNMHVRFNTNISNFSDVYVDRLNESSTIFVLNKKIITPIVGKKTTYKFNVIVDYETEHGEKQYQSLDLDLNVKPIAGLKITHSISKSTVESGEEFDVEVKVKNERIEDIKDVRVSDTIYDNFRHKGISTATIDINGLDTVTAYKYKMKAPQVENQTIFIFVTQANYTKENITKYAEKEFRVSVLPKKLDISISRTIPTPVFAGQLVDITYTIENKEEEELKDILFKFPIQQKFDLIGERTYWIEKLDPYEKLVIKEKHKIRAKENETQTLEATEFVYKDDLDNIFRKNSSRNSFDVKNSYINGVAFLITKNVSKTKINKSETIDVIILVENIGTEKGKVNITDMGRLWNLELAQGKQTKVGYSLIFDRVGKFILEPAVAEYVYLDKNVTTISNKQTIEVGMEKEIKAKEEAEEGIEEIIIEEKPKGFFAQIKELFSTLKKVIFGG